MSRRTPLLGLATAAALLVATPGTALAVTGTISQPCYSHIPTKGTQPVTVLLTGGTPGAGWVMAATAPGKALGSQGSTSGDFDASGNALATITSVFPPSGTIGPTKGQAIALTVKDYGTGLTPADQPVGQTLVTNIALNVSSSPRSPRAHRKVSVSGTPFAGKKIYGFVTKGTSKKVLRRFLIGTGNVCGFATSKQIVAPKSFKSGSYRLYVNAGIKLDKPKAIWSSFRISSRLL